MSGIIQAAGHTKGAGHKPMPAKSWWEGHGTIVVVQGLGWLGLNGKVNKC